MRAGKYLKKIYHKNKFYKLILNTFGILDLHTQIRVKPLLKFLKKNIDLFKDKLILDLGCGSGNNCFEINYYTKTKQSIGVDINQELIEYASQQAEELELSQIINFYHEDILSFKKNEKYDVVILFDILEHINDPSQIFRFIQKNISEQGIVLVSVPTYLYKKMFGIKFHNYVGHVKDGYSFEEISDLFKHYGFYVYYYKYNTGLFANLGCALYYRFDLRNKYLTLLKQLIFYPFSYLDFFNNKYLSCSIFIVFKPIKT